MRITPRRTKKPDERAKTLGEAEQAYRLARMQITNATGNFRGTYFSQQASTKESTGNSFACQSQPNGYYPRGMHFARQLVRKPKPNLMAITRGTRNGCQGHGHGNYPTFLAKAMPWRWTRPWQGMLLDRVVAMPCCWQRLWHGMQPPWPRLWHGQGCGLGHCSYS